MLTCTRPLQEPLHVIALLRREQGATFSLSKTPHEELTYSSSAWFKKTSDQTGKE